MRAMRTKVIPTCSGCAELKMAGFKGLVDYTIEGEPARLRSGIARLKGVLHCTPEIALDAFRAGEGIIVLDSGACLRLTMLGHSSGSGEVYVECRI